MRVFTDAAMQRLEKLERWAREEYEETDHEPYRTVADELAEIRAKLRPRIDPYAIAREAYGTACDCTDSGLICHHCARRRTVAQAAELVLHPAYDTARQDGDAADGASTASKTAPDPAPPPELCECEPPTVKDVLLRYCSRCGKRTQRERRVCGTHLPSPALPPDLVDEAEDSET